MRRFKRCLVVMNSVALVGWAVVAVWPVGLARYRSGELGRAVERGPGAVIDFADLGPAYWDRVYVFHPYYPREAVQEDLGFQWSGVADTSIELNDGVNLVVFVRDGAVVGWFEHPRNRGDLGGLSNRIGYSRSVARFTVQTDQEGRAILVPPGVAAEPAPTPERAGGK